MAAIPVPKIILPIFLTWAREYETSQKTKDFAKAHVYQLIGKIGAIETQTIDFIRKDLSDRHLSLNKRNRFARIFSGKHQEGALDLVDSWLNTLEEAKAS